MAADMDVHAYAASYNHKLLVLAIGDQRDPYSQLMLLGQRRRARAESQSLQVGHSPTHARAIAVRSK